jgi:hypothetical protein
MDHWLAPVTSFGIDIMALLFVAGYVLFSWSYLYNDSDRLRQYRLAILISVLTPLSIGGVFKYLLMVPLPREGLFTFLLDSIRYLDVM